MSYSDADAVIINRALQVIGTRTTVTTSELNALSSNEAIQVNLIYAPFRDQLLRMAPWNCGTAYSNLIYLTSTPGTPENGSPATAKWAPGQPPIGWSYEYLYPDDCLRACFIIPAMLTGFAGGVPIYPIPTSVGSPPASWQSPAIKFKVQLEQYLRQTLVTPTIVNGGSGFQVGDILICGGIPGTSGDVPAGLVRVQVTAVNAGVITGIELAAFTNLQKTSLFFSVPTYDLDQVDTSGVGTGAILSVGSLDVSAFVSSRVVLTNQEFATLAYVKQVTDPTVMDPDFIEAWINVLAAGLVNALTGDKALANQCISRANLRIAEARKNDGNEALTVNDVTPDWIRIRGIDFPTSFESWNGFDWGPDWGLF